MNLESESSHNGIVSESSKMNESESSDKVTSTIISSTTSRKIYLIHLRLNLDSTKIQDPLILPSVTPLNLTMRFCMIHGIKES